MIFNKSRLYSRREPFKDARFIIIYCEGKKREDQYFNYFSEINSHIKLEINPPGQHDDTSPIGLYNKAEKHLIKSDTNTNLKYELTNDDTVWFVIDTDDWGAKIPELREKCKNHMNWFVTQSNPCFEVWLLYHLHEFEEFPGIEISKNWKPFLDSKIPGGFNSKKHPIYIENAIKNAKFFFNEDLNVGSTEVFILAEKIYDFVKDEILDALKQMK